MDHGVVVPFPLIQRREMAGFMRATYDASLAGDFQYLPGQIIDLAGAMTGGPAAGVAAAASDTTAANMTKLAVAEQPYAMDSMFTTGRFKYFAARGVPVDRIDPTDEWVFTYPGTFDATAQGVVAALTEKDLVWDATNKALVIDAGVTTLHVKLLRVFAPDEVTVGTDTNVWVVCNFLPGVLA